jgi:hypothetical protein
LGAAATAVPASAAAAIPAKAKAGSFLTKTSSIGLCFNCAKIYAAILNGRLLRFRIDLDHLARAIATG